MICPPCKSAGRYMRDFKRPEEDRIEFAEGEHRRCPQGSWCDCQHYVPPKLAPAEVTA